MTALCTYLKQAMDRDYDIEIINKKIYLVQLKNTYNKNILKYANPAP